MVGLWIRQDAAARSSAWSDGVIRFSPPRHSPSICHRIFLTLLLVTPPSTLTLPPRLFLTRQKLPPHPLNPNVMSDGPRHSGVPSPPRQIQTIWKPNLFRTPSLSMYPTLSVPRGQPACQIHFACHSLLYPTFVSRHTGLIQNRGVVALSFFSACTFPVQLPSNKRLRIFAFNPIPAVNPPSLVPLRPPHDAGIHPVDLI